MNIDNIMHLTGQLQELGFGNLSAQLLKRICLKPKSFSLVTTIEKDSTRANFSIFFTKDGASDSYILKHFEGFIQLDAPLPEKLVNSVDLATLVKRMATINWRDVFNMDLNKAWDATDKTTWSTEQIVESIITDIEALDTTIEGKRIADALRLKFWSVNNYSSIIEGNGLTRNKTQIIQRFYCFENQSPITANEAFRYLLNRQLEKAMLEQSKVKELNDSAVDTNGNHTGSGLLKKKRKGRKSKDFKTR